MKYAILLRGVNIGKRTIKSAELKACLENAGFSGVETVLATGNVLVESSEQADQLKQKVEKILEATFKFNVKVKIISIKKLAEIIANFPFQKIGPEYHRYVIFRDEQPDKAALAALQLDNALEAVKAGDGVIYWRVLKGHTLDSDFAKLSAKDAAKDFSTTRNLNTLEKIIVKATL